jgi:hypothetical protein
MKYISYLTELSGEFKNIDCLKKVSELEYIRWIEGKKKNIQLLESYVKKKKSDFIIDD